MTDTQAWETKLTKTVDLSIEDGCKTIDKCLVFLSSFFFKLLKLTTDAAAAVTVCHGTCLQCKYFKCKMYLMFSSQMHFSLEPMNHFPCSIYPKVLINSVSLSTVILPVSYKYSVEASTHKWWMVEMSGATPVIFPQLGLEADWWEYNKHHCRENKYLVNLQMDIPYLDIYIFKGLTYLDSGSN